jgi:hypothetical protein
MKDILLKKPKARTAILFKPDKDDDWFVYVIHFELKSGKQTSKSMIIKKDVDQRINGYLSKGWAIADEKIGKIIDDKKSNKEEDQDDDPF